MDFLCESGYSREFLAAAGMDFEEDWDNAIHDTPLGDMTPDEFIAYADPLQIRWIVRRVSDPLSDAIHRGLTLFDVHVLDWIEDALYSVKNEARYKGWGDRWLTGINLALAVPFFVVWLLQRIIYQLSDVLENIEPCCVRMIPSQRPSSLIQAVSVLPDDDDGFLEAMRLAKARGIVLDPEIEALLEDEPE